MFVSVGDQVKTGEVLIMMEATSDKKSKSDSTKDVKTPEKNVTVNKEIEEQKKEKTENKKGDKVFASPGVRRLSRELDSKQGV